MVICFDAGNSDLVAGLFCDGKLVKTCRIDYEKEQTKEQYTLLLQENMSKNNINPDVCFAVLHRTPPCLLRRLWKPFSVCLL